MRPTRDSLIAGGALTGLGIVLAIAQVYDAGMAPASIWFGTAPFVLVAAAVAFVGVHVVRTGMDAGHARRVLAWTVGGLALFAAVAALIALGSGFAAGADHLVAAVLDDATAGALAGALVGIYDVRGLERLADLRRQRDRIEAFAGEAASLNRYGKALNESTSLDAVSALCVEALEVVIGRSGAAFVLVEDGDATIVDDALETDDSRRAVREIATEAATRPEIEVEVHESSDGDHGTSLSIPIPVDERTRAVLVAATEDDARYEDEELDLLELLAAHAATALANLEERPGTGGPGRRG